MADDTFSIIHDAGSATYPASTLLVGIDETGHEAFSDAKHPVFGLGGCAVLLRDYEQLIDGPWRYMKQRFFFGVDKPLHAADLRNPTSEQLEALEHFFTRFSFFRFAVMVAGTLVNNTDYPLIQVVCRALWERIADVAKWVQPTEVIVVIEQSERTKKDIYGYLAEYRMGHEEIDIEPRVFLATKKAQQSFMEVADFIMHAAGAQVRNRLLGRVGVRRDFAAVFHKPDQRLTSYIELLQVNAKVQQGAPANAPLPVV